MQVNQKKHASGAGRELLMLTLGRGKHCSDILKVPEIRGYGTVTTIASASKFIKGVIGLPASSCPSWIGHQIQTAWCHLSRNPCHILNIANRAVCSVVHGVSEVTTLKADEIKLPRGFGSGLDVKDLQGMSGWNASAFWGH